MAALKRRQPYDEPVHPDGPSTTDPVRKIQIRHPGYRDQSNILIQFDAYDNNRGIHYQTAHTACALLTDNRWDGYFSADANGMQRVEPSTSDVILEDDKYYFQVPGERLYAVVPTFAVWSFPHDNLPAAWQHSPSASSNPIHRPADQVRCSMTQSTVPLEIAHIVPVNRSDMKWWNNNGMSRYAGRDSTNNIIRFRVDVHQIFDRKPGFAIVPKDNALLAHFFHATKNTAEAVRLYHNVPLQFPESVQMEFLLARLAWTVFPCLEIFLSSGKHRTLSRIGENDMRVVEEMDGDECYQIYVRSRARSFSSRKRNNNQVDPAGPTDKDYRSDSESATDNVDEYQQRGRMRRRSFSKGFSYTRKSPTGCLHRFGSDAYIFEDASLLTRLQT